MADIDRMKKMIECDRFGFADGSKDMIRKDIEDVLNEYFYIPSHIRIELDKNGERFDLKISATNCSLKSFNVLK